MLKRKKMDTTTFSPLSFCTMILVYFATCKVHIAAASANYYDGSDDQKAWDSKVGPMLPIDQRRSVFSSEYGEISAGKVTDGINGSYYLQFITLEPNSLFLPVILHSDMVFYVQTGSGRLTWISNDGGGGDDDTYKNGKKKKEKKGDDKSRSRSQEIRIHKGDVYRLPPGSIFFIQSDLEPDRYKLRISAIFANSEQDLREPLIGPYSSIRDLVLGFDKKVLQAAFQISEESVEEITSSTKPLQIVHGLQDSSRKRTLWELEARYIETMFGRSIYAMNKKEKSSAAADVYNILSANPDFHNCNGWSTTVTSEQLPSLQGSSIGIFMVNLTRGAMMGPHWNPMATEIGIVLGGRGMVVVVCSSSARETGCRNRRFRVKEGDVFVVPRFHPMAQMAFNNGTFVFVGFTTTNLNNHPQFLAGKWSVLRTLNRQVVAQSFNVGNSTVGELLASQDESVILECISCAEEEEKVLEEEIEEDKEESRKKEEEEARKRQEEERKQEEEARKREEEEAREQEEEEKRRREREEAAAAAAAARKKAEEEARRKAEEKARKEEEEARREEEEQAEAEARRREEEKARKEEEKEARRREEEKAQQEEEARQREEEEAQAQEEKRREEESRRKEEEEAARRRKEEAQQQEEGRREEEAGQRKEEQEQEEEGEREREAGASEEGEGARQQEETEEERQEQEEAEVWPGAGGEGKRVLRKMWTG